MIFQKSPDIYIDTEGTQMTAEIVEEVRFGVNRMLDKINKESL